MNNIDFDAIDLTKEAPVTEPERQYYYIAKARKYVSEKAQEIGRNLTFCVTTFGCQMNARDSEKLVGVLELIGYKEEPDEEKADFVIYNTCTVRENANLRVYGRLGQLGAKKKKNPHMFIGLCGCMMQEPTVVEKIKKSYRFVDLIFGTHNIYKFAELIVTRFESERMVIDIWKDTDKIVEDLPSERKFSFKSGVNIMFGCNNFCSYCIVPYVRGRERSRNPKDIIREIEGLVADGVVEVMLLGQNVNSYGKNLEEPMTFAQLLQEIEKIEGLERIRFMTSHPKDLSDELINVMAHSKKICKHLHLPVQSGSSRILQKMNRHYTKEHYLEVVRKIREAVPDISLTTDIIVGFPGETEEDFQDTLDIVRQVRYALKDVDGNFDVHKSQARIYVDCEGDYDYEDTVEHLKRVFGLVGICPVVRMEDKGFEELKKDVVAYMAEMYPDRNFTFKVESRRARKSYPKNSMEISRDLGEAILYAFPEIKVDLHLPDVLVNLEVRNEIYVYSEIIPGAGGMPVGTNGNAMLLLSGGIDSPVAGYMVSKRGVGLEATYFHAPPYTSERAKQKVVDLAKIVARYSGPIKLHVVNFTDIQ